MDNKSIFAKNLTHYMKVNEKTRRDVCQALGFSYYTFSDWCNGKKYPRMDKVELLADYFGILKSDLIEERTEGHRKMQQKNDDISDIVMRLRMDDEFLSVVKALHKMEPEKLSSLLAFIK